jgi:hypothetical protein
MELILNEPTLHKEELVDRPYILRHVQSYEMLRQGETNDGEPDLIQIYGNDTQPDRLEGREGSASQAIPSPLPIACQECDERLAFRSNIRARQFLAAIPVLQAVISSC